MDQARLQRTAYHEAGHAVAAYGLGFPLIFVSVQEDGRGWGRCYAEVSGPSVAGAVFCLAGTVTEERALGTPDPHSQSGDNTKAMRHLPAHQQDRFRRNHNGLRRDLYDQAETVVADRWAAVEALADALMHKPVIAGSEAVSIIEQALSHTAP